MTDPVVIVAARRTAMGSFLGELSPLSATQLGASVIRAVTEAHVPPDEVSEVLMGCVLPAGLGQAPARQAALGGGLPDSVPCTTLNKVCGSGMKTIMLGHDLLRAGSARVVVAGGMESMSNAPHLLAGSRLGHRIGPATMADHMMRDGLENAADGLPMGEFAERCADQYGFGREEQDAYGLRSVERALQACESGAFTDEIVPLEVSDRKKNTHTVDRDEQPYRARPERIPTLRPAFRSDGTVTAATSASISDGAAAVLLMHESEAKRRDLPVLARIVGHAGHARAPEDFTTAPIGAIRNLCEHVGWAPDEADLYEINEAFAVVAMAAIRDLGLNPEHVNPDGGACAMGHPIGCTGARLVVTLVHSLRRRGLSRGIASLCIGGGEATAVALEIPAG